MRKIITVSLAAFSGSLAALLLLLGLPLGVRAGASGPATDQRFCADANGDGRVDVSDAVTVLNFLFNGTVTPYCIAQSQSLPFATKEETDQLRAELQTLRQQVNTVPRIYEGSYLGDGKSGRMIETGATGTIRSLWLAGRCPKTTTPDCTRRSDYFQTAWINPEMEPGIAVGAGGTRLDNPNFIVGEALNSSNWEYIWTALVTPQ